jgi:hypothetical protein
MTPGPSPGDSAGTLQTTDRIDAVAERVEASALPFAVADATGAIVGHVGSRAVVDVLVGRRR